MLDNQWEPSHTYDMNKHLLHDLTSERVRFLFTFDEDRGVLVRNFRLGKAKRGSVASCKDKEGYVIVGIDGRIYRAHRVIWLYKTGAWPHGDIDHIDRSKDNNRFANLRDVTRSQNKQNQLVHRTNRSGFKGVWRNTQTKCERWVAEITVNGKTHRLGNAYKTEEEAASAYSAAAAILHEFNPCASKT